MIDYIWVFEEEVLKACRFEAGANMQHTSFLPGCYSTRGLNIGANGGTWPIYNNDRSLKNEHSYNVFFPPPTPEQYLGYNKEVLRQTMLKHEATFRDQVHELHRVYRRQNELMHEIKRELAEQQLQLQTVQSNPFLSQNSSKYPQTMWQISANFREPSSFIPSKSTEDSPKDCELLDPKGKKSKRRILNLELPADEYIESEEGEGLGEEKVFEVPEVPSSQPKMSEAFPTSDFKLFPDPFSRRTNDLADLNEPVVLEDGSSPNCFATFGLDAYHVEIPCRDRGLSEKTTSGVQILSGRNVQMIPGREVKACSEIMHLQKDQQQELDPHNDKAGQRRSNMNSLPQVSSSRKLHVPSNPLQSEHCAKLSTPTRLINCSPRLWNERTQPILEASKKSHDLFNNNYPGLLNSRVPFSHQLVPVSDVAKSGLSSFSSQRKPIRFSRENPIAVQALPCFNAPVPLSKICKSSEGSRGNQSKCFQGSDLMDVNTPKVMDLNFMPPSSFVETETSEQNDVKKIEDSLVGLPWLRGKEDYKGKPNALLNPSEEKDLYKGEKVDKRIDLNSCVYEDESSLTQSFPNLVVEKMAERDLEAPVSPENQECSPPRGESEENQLEIPLSKPEHGDPQEELVKMAAEAIVVISSSRFPRLFFENGACEPLHWFADVVSSLNGEDVGDQKEISSDGSDYFEAMTLKLPEINVEEYLSNRDGKLDSILSPKLPRKGRTRRVKQRKDFQTELLPSLASLSRHEVTEDLQTIGGLMEAAGTPLENCLGRRNVCTRGRRRGNISLSNMVEGVSRFLPLKLPSNDGIELAILERSPASWGKKKRRRRVQRFRVSNPHTILGVQ